MIPRAKLVRELKAQLAALQREWATRAKVGGWPSLHDADPEDGSLEDFSQQNVIADLAVEKTEVD